METITDKILTKHFNEISETFKYYFINRNKKDIYSTFAELIVNCPPRSLTVFNSLFHEGVSEIQNPLLNNKNAEGSSSIYNNFCTVSSVKN